MVRTYRPDSAFVKMGIEGKPPGQFRSPSRASILCGESGVHQPQDGILFPLADILVDIVQEGGDLLDFGLVHSDAAYSGDGAPKWATQRYSRYSWTKSRVISSAVATAMDLRRTN